MRIIRFVFKKSILQLDFGYSIIFRIKDKREINNMDFLTATSKYIYRTKSNLHRSTWTVLWDTAILPGSGFAACAG